MPLIVTYLIYNHLIFYAGLFLILIITVTLERFISKVKSKQSL